MEDISMKILLIAPNAEPRPVEIDGSLASMQELVGGLIEAVYPFSDPVALVCNDEGKLTGLPQNRPLKHPETGKLYGTPAVIDKDFASAKLAELLDADMLVILTAVEKVAINFGKPDQKGLDTLTPDEARKYIDEKQFAPGSMLPKVQAAMSFAESKPGRVARITLLEKAAEGIEGKTGTRVQM
jgi:hypothetical protein